MKHLETSINGEGNITIFSCADGFRIRADGFHIRADGFHIRADGFRIRADGFHTRADGFHIRADDIFTLRGDSPTRRDEFSKGEVTRALDNFGGIRGSGSIPGQPFNLTVTRRE